MFVSHRIDLKLPEVASVAAGPTRTQLNRDKTVNPMFRTAFNI